jgi:hypothetical protein
MNWDAWKFDIFTWVWIVWIAQFAIWEAYTLIFHNGQELTAHLRPVFQSYDPIYFLAVGLWLWLGWHFLIDGLWVHRWGIAP